MEVQVASEIDAFKKQKLVCFAKDAKQFMVPASNYLPSGRKVARSGKERCLTKLRGSALDLAAQSSILKPPLTPSSAETAKNCALARRWNSLEEREEDDWDMAQLVVWQEFGVRRLMTWHCCIVPPFYCTAEPGIILLSVACKSSHPIPNHQINPKTLQANSVCAKCCFFWFSCRIPGCDWFYSGRFAVHEEGKINKKLGEKRRAILLFGVLSELISLSNFYKLHNIPVMTGVTTLNKLTTYVNYDYNLGLTTTFISVVMYRQCMVKVVQTIFLSCLSGRPTFAKIFNQKYV